jgi:DNA-nicking Smr family endonuclease
VVVPIEESFDLHPFHPSEAISMLDAYLDAALEAGFREVRLIHGRGKGVQRARVRKWLDADPRIERFEEAPPGRGGWGATLARLHVADESAPASSGRPAAEKHDN